MRSRTVVLAAGCALAAVALAGCKSAAASNAGAAPTPTHPAVATSIQSSAPTLQTSASVDQTSASASGGVAVCSLLPVATVAQLSGEALITQQEEDLANAQTYTCAYTGAVGSSKVAVTVDEKNAVNSFNAGVAAYGASAKPIIGVGDKAYSGPLGQVALFGTTLISVTGVDNDDAAAKIIETLQPKL
ncbi:MAG TPA: hypothetical protein VGF84_07575 [Micromonosporaceae bacterium]|jgi:hypothetical protein